MSSKPKTGFLLCIVVLAGACGSAENQSRNEENIGQSVPVTVTTAVARDLEVWASSVGQLEPKISPLIAAEVAGRLTAVYFDVGDHIERGQVLAEIDATDFQLARDMAQADIDRVEALIHAEQLKVTRFQALVEKQSVNQSDLDDAQAQLGALQAERVSAQVRLQQAQLSLSRARITSPIRGRVDDTQVSIGDYVKVGAPLMRIGNFQYLKARLPYPETLLPKLHAGLAVRLSSPSAPQVSVETTVSEVRPSITFGGRAAQVIVNLENPGPWDPGATVTASVRIAVRKGATMLPEVSVVLRPAGAVVYVINDGKASQRVVTVGLRRDGQVEILSGLAVGEQVAADGAGFLSDGVAVRVKGS